MTKEQLENANQIMDRIRKLIAFKVIFDCNDPENAIFAKYNYKEVKLQMDDIPQLRNFISGFLADEIAELKRQFEEL